MGFQNEIISFFIPFLTRGFDQPTTFEFSLKVTLFVCLFLFDSYIANGWIGMTSTNSLGNSAIYEISTFSKSGSVSGAAK